MEDQRPVTYEHIQMVQRLLNRVIGELLKRGEQHDQSKLHAPERGSFDKHTPKLREMTYNSPEYKACLADMKPELEHHYANNRHHPEFFKNGIAGMTLIDQLEMLCDWKAATTRHADGNLFHSIEENQKRFGYSDELKGTLINTAHWIEDVWAN